MISSHDDRKNWHPDVNQVKELKAEIEHLYDTNTKSPFDDPYTSEQSKIPESSFIEQCAKISAFLMDKKAVMNQLERLNAILVEKIKNGDNGNSVYLLRQTIEEELGKLGFHPNLAKAVQVVQASIFRAAVVHGLLKDVPLGNSSHGEFTHALQWLAIAWQQQDNNFLGRPAINVFKEIGEEKSVYFRTTFDHSISKTIPRYESNLWDFIVDQFDRSTNFRSPDVFHNYLTTLEKKLTVLTSLLKKRYEKRLRIFYYDKYSPEQLSQPSSFGRKNNREHYEHLPDVLNKILTPKNIKIDMDSFYERSCSINKK